MRIAFFHATLPEAGRKLGGVEVFVHRLANRLCERGHEVTVFTFGAGPADARYRVAAAGPRRLAAGRISRLTVAPLALNRLALGAFDVAHLHGDDWLFFARGLPTVRTFYGSALFEARSATAFKRRVAQSLVYPLEAVASRLATVSYDIGTALPAPYRIAGSLPLAVEPPARRETEPAGHPTVLFVGTWRGRKRGAFLADVFAREVRPVLGDAELVVVADDCVPAPGVRWVRFPPDAELARLYAAATVFCMPSTYEGFGLPYLEAMVHGTPVVATPNAGARHVLRAGGGVIVDDTDLGATLVRLLTDRPARLRLGAAGRHAAEAFSWPRVVAAHERAYATAIAAYRPRRVR